MHKYVIIWIMCGLVSAGLANKNFQSDDFRWSTFDKCEQWSRKHQSFSLVWGMAGGPFALVVSLAVTGFGYHGWSLSRKECIGY